MRGVNRVILVGNVCADPELRATQSGDSVCNFSLATSEEWKGKDGAKQEKTEFHRIVVFGKLAEICGQYLKKGSPAYIEGKIQTRKWQGQDGRDNYTTEIVASTMQMLGSKPDSAKPVRGNMGKPDAVDLADDFDDGEILF